jgi:hypothetical protein
MWGFVVESGMGELGIGNCKIVPHLMEKCDNFERRRAGFAAVNSLVS